jgi:transcriptional regulator with XRE-family HTH domain
MPFGMRLKDALKARTISISKLSHLLGVSRTATNDWINNKGMRTQHLIKICLMLNLSMDWLILGKGEKNLLGSKHLSMSEWKLLQVLRIANPESVIHLNTLINSIFKNFIGDDLSSHITGYNAFNNGNIPYFLMNDIGTITLSSTAFDKIIDEITQQEQGTGLNLIDIADNCSKFTAITFLDDIRAGRPSQNILIHIKSTKKKNHALLLSAVKADKGVLRGIFCMANKVSNLSRSP